MRCPFASWRPSPNFSSRQGEEALFGVNHITDGQPVFERAVSRFCDEDTNASPHFIVGQAGELTQLVELDQAAWHAGASKAARRRGLKGWNFISYGIEHVARSPGEFDEVWPHLSERKRLALLPPELAHLVDSPTDPGFPLTEPQLKTSARLLAWICKLRDWPVDRDHIRGHYECPATTHEDCGLGEEQGGIWPWERYLEMVRAELSQAG